MFSSSSSRSKVIDHVYPVRFVFTPRGIYGLCHVTELFKCTYWRLCFKDRKNEEWEQKVVASFVTLHCRLLLNVWDSAHPWSSPSFSVFIFLHAKSFVKLVSGVIFIQHMAEVKWAAAGYSKVYSFPTARCKEQVYLLYLPGVCYLLDTLLC